VELITYKLVTDLDGRLKEAARLACNFWNRFLAPGYSVVIRLGIFTASSNTIARAYKPFQKDGVHYGVVEFNTKYLAQFSTTDTAGTIIHEIGHVLGMGWDNWNSLYDHEGRFLAHAIEKVPALADMRIELAGGNGTKYSHWDERIFDAELMTGYKDNGEYVLPVTLAVMELLGHHVVEHLPQARPLNDLLAEVANLVFSMQDEVRTIDLEHFEATGLAETIPHVPM
jgi:predicted Zn-dependent protease with MMP-like domain